MVENVLFIYCWQRNESQRIFIQSCFFSVAPFLLHTWWPYTHSWPCPCPIQLCMCVWCEMSAITNSHVRCDVESERKQVDVVVFEVDEVDERRPTTRANKEMKMNEDENKSINTVWCYCYSFYCCCLFMPFLFLFQTHTRAHTSTISHLFAPSLEFIGLTVNYRISRAREINMASNLNSWQSTVINQKESISLALWAKLNARRIAWIRNTQNVLSHTYTHDTHTHAPEMRWWGIALYGSPFFPFHFWFSISLPLHVHGKFLPAQEGVCVCKNTERMCALIKIIHIFFPFFQTKWG